MLGGKSYNLGAIVARRLHRNRFNGDFFGGIYATRLADFLGVTIHNDDIELPPTYLDFNAMFTTSLSRGMNHHSGIA